MGAKTKKVKAAGRFGAGYGKPKERLIIIESKQRKKQKCPFCNGTAKRIFFGVWSCKKCQKRFTGNSYFLESFK
ncbi:MAG: 50S ribosomal protein L37ae [Candidatus Pacearchaeota archaeon]